MGGRNRMGGATLVMGPDVETPVCSTKEMHWYSGRGEDRIS